MTITTQAIRRVSTEGLPEELKGMVPRHVGLSRDGIALAIVAGAFAVAALVSAIAMSIVYGQQERDRQLRAREGAGAVATVTDVRTSRGEHPRRIVTYRYDVEGRRYVAETTLREGDRMPLARGGTVSINYVSSQPATSWMVGYEPRGMPVGVIPLVSLSLLTISVLMAWALRRQWILLSEGRAVLARVTQEKKVRRGHHETHSISYQFQTLSGSTRTGSFESNRRTLATGAVVPVVYHRDNPKWSAKYPMPLVRPRRLR